MFPPFGAITPDRFFDKIAVPSAVTRACKLQCSETIVSCAVREEARYPLGSAVFATWRAAASFHPRGAEAWGSHFVIGRVMVNGTGGWQIPNRWEFYSVVFA
jgi:hypothetical protein